LANKIKQYQIKQAQIILQIKDTNLRLSDLQLQLMQSQAAIDENERDIVSTRNNLAAVLKQLWKSQTFTFLDFIASSDNFSDFCNREHTYTMINSGLKDMLQSLKTTCNKANRI
jgi:peptidoglycan hydrolase CwlO-like protein